MTKNKLMTVGELIERLKIFTKDKPIAIDLGNYRYPNPRKVYDGKLFLYKNSSLFYDGPGKEQPLDYIENSTVIISW